MQDRVSVDGFREVQPTKFDWSFETTSTQDSGRAMSGAAYITPMFTVEAFDVEYRNLTVAQCSLILKAIVQKPSKPFFSLHYFSPYYGAWRTAQFYVGNGSLSIKTLKSGKEHMQAITCRFIGKDKVQ